MAVRGMKIRVPSQLKGGISLHCRKNGCPWDKFTIMFAEQASHLKLLAWAKDNGCPHN